MHVYLSRAKQTLITLNKNTFINPARLIDNPDSLADNLMTSIFSLKFNSLAPFEKTDFVPSWSKEYHVMFGMKTILVRSLWNPLLGFFFVIKEIFAFSVAGLLSLSTHALTCLNRQHWKQ